MEKLMAYYKAYLSKKRRRLQSINVLIRKTPSYFINKDRYYRELFKELCLKYGLSYCIRIFDDSRAIDEYEKENNQDKELIKKHFLSMFAGPFIASGSKLAEISHYPSAIVHDPVYGGKVRLERFTLKNLLETNNKAYKHETYKCYFEIEYANLVPIQFKDTYKLVQYDTKDPEFADAIEEYFRNPKRNPIDDFSENVSIKLGENVDIADEFLKIKICEISAIEAFNEKTGEIKGIKFRGYYAISDVPSKLIADSLFKNWVTGYSEKLLKIIYHKRIRYKGNCKVKKVKKLNYNIFGKADIVLVNRLGI